MAYYNTCPVCGANLDPNEKCDCYLDEQTCSDEVRELGLLKLKDIRNNRNYY